MTVAYPFLAFSSGAQLCGATLIWSDILLSAGHCSGAFLNGGVWIGGIQLNGADGEYHQVESVLVHESYPVVSTQPHDIMLLKIATQSLKQPVTLVTNTDLPAEGVTVKVLGFGNTELGSVSQVAKEVEVSVVNLPACDELYGGKLIEAQFCTDGNGDSCQGDSGGPLLNSNDEQVGIVSFGEGCDQYPSVNTRVSNYTNWIQQGICSLSSSPPTDCPSGVVPTVSTSAPIAPTQTPTFLPIRLLTASPVTVPPVTATTPSPVTNAPTIPTASITLSDPPSDQPSLFPTLIPSTIVVGATSPPTILPTILDGEQSAETPVLTRLPTLETAADVPVRPSLAPIGTSQSPPRRQDVIFLAIIGMVTSVALYEPILQTLF